MFLTVTRILLPALLILIGAMNSYAADEQDEASSYSADLFPQWLIGCDNLKECSAVGYPHDPSDSIDEPWYITAKWKKNSDNVVFSAPFGWSTGDPKEKEYLANLSFQLCIDNGQCRPITAQDGMQISTQTDHNDVSKVLKFTINMKGLTDKSHLIFNEYTDAPIYFKDFLENRNAITAYPFSQLGGKQKTYKMKTVDTSLSNAEVKKIYPKYNSDDNDDDIKNEQDCLSPNYAVEYENGDKFIFACSNAGFNTEVGKYNGKTYQNFNVVDAATADIRPGMTSDNIFSRIYFDDNKKTFTISNIGRGMENLCGLAYNFAYNGEKFIIDTIRYMPICIGLPMEDWPVIYKRPS